MKQAPCEVLVPGEGAERIRGLTKAWVRSGVGMPADVPLVERVLRARGLSGGAEADAFLNPSLKQLHDPSTLPGLDRAADRILRAARDGESLVIYGDYDVDGVSATAILFHALRAIVPGCRVSTYVPHRLEEGYGLSVASVGELAQRGADLIVSVDCGVTAFAAAAEARQRGVDLIITDHHNLPGQSEGLPDAHTIVHPRLPGSDYPFGDLCGAGVAFKLAWRLLTMAQGAARLDGPMRELLLELLGLASLGVIADVVPLLGENRVIAKFGLARIKYSTLPGLRAIVEASGLGGERVSAEGVGFQLAPRLNACGRMGHAREAVELLTEAQGARANEIAHRLCRLNDERRRTEKTIFEQACEMAHEAGMTGGDRRAIVLAHPEWHAGVVGVVCSRLTEKFARPAILLARSEGVCHGSGRSVEGVNLHKLLEQCSSHLTSFGGHDMAAGLKLAEESLGAFREAFTESVNEVLSEDGLMPRVSYDAAARLGEISPAAVEAFERLAPFGRDNPPVRLRVQGVRVANPPRLMGTDQKHVAVFLDEGAQSGAVRAVAWNWGERAGRLQAGARLEVLVVPKVSTWNGARRLELEIVDVRVTESQS